MNSQETETNRDEPKNRNTEELEDQISDIEIDIEDSTTKDTTEITKVKMNDKQMTSSELMTFMMTFKNTIENTMTGIGKEINSKIDEKLTNLDRGLVNLTAEVRKNDNKQEENTRRLEARLNKLEINADRLRFARVKRNSEENLDGNKTDSCRSNGKPARKEERIPGNFQVEDQPTEEASEDVNMDEEDPLDISPRLIRANSWAEEVAETFPNRDETHTGRGDTEQWVNTKRNPSSWADNLQGDVRQAASMAGRNYNLDKNPRMESRREHSTRMDIR